jgi:hypothetical protein
LTRMPNTQVQIFAASRPARTIAEQFRGHSASPVIRSAQQASGPCRPAGRVSPRRTCRISAASLRLHNSNTPGSRRHRPAVTPASRPGIQKQTPQAEVAMRMLRWATLLFVAWTSPALAQSIRSAPSPSRRLVRPLPSCARHGRQARGERLAPDPFGNPAKAARLGGSSFGTASRGPGGGPVNLARSALVRRGRRLRRSPDDLQQSRRLRSPAHPVCGTGTCPQSLQLPARAHAQQCSGAMLGVALPMDLLREQLVLGGLHLGGRRGPVTPAANSGRAVWIPPQP